jgi:hypothetical protein
MMVAWGTPARVGCTGHLSLLALRVYRHLLVPACLGTRWSREPRTVKLAKQSCPCTVTPGPATYRTFGVITAPVRDQAKQKLWIATHHLLLPYGLIVKLKRRPLVSN